MPAFLEPVQGYALRIGKDASSYGDPYTSLGIVKFKEGRWTVGPFVRGEGELLSPAAIHRATREAMGTLGITEYWWERIRGDGVSHWIGPVRTI